MDRWEELALHGAATGDRRKQGFEPAWKALLAQYAPMIERFTPRWLRGEDREDWQSELRFWFMDAVRSYDPLRGVKLSSYLYTCLWGVQQRTQHHMYAQKRNPRLATSLNVEARGDTHGVGGEPEELIALLVDERRADPEEVASLRELVLSVDAGLAWDEVPAWRWIVACEGDVEAAVKESGMPKEAFTHVLRQARGVLGDLKEWR